MNRSVTEALSHGWGAVARLRDIVFGTYLASFVLALPLALVVADAISEAIGSSLAGERLVSGFDALWFQGFSNENSGLAGTFDPSVSGIGAVARALDTMVRGAFTELHPAVFAVGVIYLVLWVFVSAGILGGLSMGARRSFWADAVRHFPRVLALSSIALLVYAVLFRYVLGGLDTAVETLTEDVVDERIAFGYALGKYAVVWALAWTVSLVFDYAKIVAVCEPEASLRDALGSALRFVRAHRWATYGLSAVLFAIGVAVVLGYAVIAPGATQSNGFQLAIAFVISQTYILARITLRTWNLTAATSLLRGDAEQTPPEATLG